MEAPTVQIDTTMGSFEVELYHKHAPMTVKNFVELSKRGYYDGIKVCAAAASAWRDQGRTQAAIALHGIACHGGAGDDAPARTPICALARQLRPCGLNSSIPGSIFVPAAWPLVVLALLLRWWSRVVLWLLAPHAHGAPPLVPPLPPVPPHHPGLYDPGG